MLESGFFSKIDGERIDYAHVDVVKDDGTLRDTFFLI